MRKFTLKLIVFLLPLIFLIGITEYKARFIQNEFYQKRLVVERKIESTEIINLGSSHTYYGIKAQMFGKPALNLANPYQDLYYDKQILFKYLPRAKNLKLVIISVSYPSIEGELGNDWQTSFFLRFLDLPSKSNIPKLTDYSSIGLFGIKASRDYLLTGQMPKTDQIDETGSIVDFKPANPSLSKGDGALEFHESVMKMSTATENVKDLSQMIEELQARNIQVILITTPCFHTYYDNVNPQNYAFMQETLRKISSTYNVKYFNYFKDPRFNESDFMDSNHLSTVGAEKFTTVIKEEIISKTFNVSVPE